MIDIVLGYYTWVTMIKKERERKKKRGKREEGERKEREIHRNFYQNRFIN